MWIKEIRIDGAPVALTEWLARLTIRHGRGNVYDEPTASTASLVLLDPPRAFVKELTVGQRIAIDAESAPGSPPPVNRTLARFRGRITDLALDDPELSIIAAGPLAELKRQSVSTAGWAALPWSQTVERLLTACGVTVYDVNAPPGWDPIVEPPPEAEIAVSGYLTELALTVGAAVFDTPDGGITVDAIAARTLPGRVGLLTLNPSNVLYSPDWAEQLDITNRITVTYGPDRSTSATVSEADSVALYGPRRTEITTTLQSYDDAQRRAAERASRSAWPHWTLQPVRLIDAPAVEFPIGHRVTITELPPSAPYATWSPVVEGWSDIVEGPRFGLELYVSDPIASGINATWEDATGTWAQAPPTLTWERATTPLRLRGSDNGNDD